MLNKLKSVWKDNQNSIIILGVIFFVIIISVYYTKINNTNTETDISGNPLHDKIIINEETQFTLTDAENEFEEILVFNILSESLSEEEREKNSNGFEVVKKNLLAVIDNAGKGNSSSVGAYLFGPTMSIANIHRDVGNYVLAEKAYLLAHTLQPNSYAPFGNLGDMLKNKINDFKTAEKYYLQAIEYEHSYTEQFYSELYEIYRFHYGEVERAEDFLISGIEKYPDKTDILALLALHYRQLDQYDKAIETYKKLLEVKPDSIVAKQGLEQLES